jgi:hypothetical protein
MLAAPPPELLHNRPLFRSLLDNFQLLKAALLLARSDIIRRQSKALAASHASRALKILPAQGAVLFR